MEASKTDPEAALLGCLLLDNRAIPETRQRVAKKDFADMRHREIYSAICDLADAGKNADAVTVFGAMPPRSIVDGDYIGSLIDVPHNTEMAEVYAKQVAETAKRRRVREAARRLQEEGGTYEGETARRLLEELAPEPVVSVIEEVEDGFKPQTIPQLRAVMSEIAAAPRIPSGIAELDGLIGGGFMAGKTVIAGAFVGNGKTTFLINQAVRHAFNGHPVLFVSAELSAPEIGLMIDNTLSPTDDPDVPNLQVIYADRPLEAVIGMTVKWLEGVAGSEDAPVVVVDFLQRISNPRQQSRELQVSEIAWAFQSVGRRYNALMVLAAQLNRQSQGQGGEGEDAPKPMLHHLRESGNIEQVADLVILLQKSGDDTLKLFVAKNRNGKTADVEVSADFPRCAFGTLSDAQKFSKLGEKVVQYLDDHGSPADIRDIMRKVKIKGTHPHRSDITMASIATKRFFVDDTTGKVSKNFDEK